MLINKIYYIVKPFLPWTLRVALRRQRAKSRRITYARAWPIDYKAGETPSSWPGWPEGKRFAVVLTHDVEGRKGLGRVDLLKEMELKHGFRSSFNFVPENEYRLPDSLREMLDRAGFEIGVHGLQHDGKLFASKRTFAAKAGRIRKYLDDWKACGFRAPLMQHRLGWMHQLGIDYDASTFDTDPFEPEPDGVGTIFPFWVPGPGGTGFVELPYTLTQDFTLFVILRESDIDIWKRKLDWVAERGGMVLLNSHPDYMCFEGKKTCDEYPVSYYEDLLRYVREKYDGLFWHALPRDVSQYYRATVLPDARNSRKKICMLAYTHYESDGRVRRYAETLVRRGDQVEVIALSEGTAPLGMREFGGVRVYRILGRSFDERSKWTYALRLLRFLWFSSVFLTRRHSLMRYDIIHVHNVPDFLVFAAWYPKLTGAKVILDIHDIVPELFASKFKTGFGSGYVRMLKIVEKASAAFADHVVVSNHLWYKTLISRSVGREKCSVFLNQVDPVMFYRHPRTRNDGKLIMIFPGTFQWHQGLDIAIEALAHLKDRIPNLELHLYGGGGSAGTQDDLSELARQLGLKERVKFSGGVPFDRIAGVIANADLGVVPKRADSFGNEAYSTKIMECMSQGVPVVVSRTKIDSFYFDDSLVRFFPSGDSRAMADAIVEAIENAPLRNTLIANGLDYASRHSWDQKKREYLELVDSLFTESFDGTEGTILPEPKKSLAKNS